MARMQDDDMLDKELDFKREQMDRAAVASGNVDENSALYRHAKLNGWDLGSDEPFHGQAGRKWYAAEQAAKGRMMDARADMMEADADLRAGYDGIVANATAQRLDRARRGRATLGSIVGHAMRNGGMVPRELAQSVGMELGDPGFVGGTLAKDGTFMSLGRGGKGGIQPTGVVSPLEVAKAMKDSGNWRDAQKYVKQFLKGRLTDQQIESATGYSDLWAQQTAAKDRQRRSAEIEKVVLDGIRDMLKDKPDMTPGEAWRSLVKNNPKALESYLTRPATEDEAASADANGNVSLSPEEGFRKFESLWNLGKSGGAAAEQSGNPRLDQIGALIDRLEKMNAPAPADPNAVEMRQRANARANVIDAAGGRQQLIYEQMPDGTLTTTSGYVANGRVYDANGDEMQGEFYQNYVKSDKEGEPGRFVGRIVPAAQPAQGQIAEYDPAKADSYQPGQHFVRGGKEYEVYMDGGVKRARPVAQGGADYGLRNDGKTYKGTGWLGELRLPDGGVATEYTMQSDAVRDANGNRIDFPTLVPTLTKAEQDLMVNDIIPNRKPVPDEIAQKAVDFARMRLANGQSVFANDGQTPAQGGAASSPLDDMAQPVTELGRAAQTQEQGKTSVPADIKADRKRLAEELRSVRETEALRDENGNLPDSEDLPEPKPMTDADRQAEVDEWGEEAVRKARAGKNTRRQTLAKYGVNEGIAQQYDGIDRGLISRFAEAMEIPVDDVYSGKYDKELSAYVERMGDADAKSAVAKAGELRKQKQKADKVAERDAEYQKRNEDIEAKYAKELKDGEAEIERKAIRKGWDKERTDFELNKLRNRVRLGRERDLQKSEKDRYGIFHNLD